MTNLTPDDYILFQKWLYTSKELTPAEESRMRDLVSELLLTIEEMDFIITEMTPQWPVN